MGAVLKFFLVQKLIFGHFGNRKKRMLVKTFFVKLIYLISGVFWPGFFYIFWPTVTSSPCIKVIYLTSSRISLWHLGLTLNKIKSDEFSLFLNLKKIHAVAITLESHVVILWSAGLSSGCLQLGIKSLLFHDLAINWFYWVLP